MKVTQEKLPASQIGLEIEIPAETSKQAYEKVIQNLSRSLKLPGFRQGKIPRQILLQRVGPARIRAEALENLIQESLEKAVEQESLNVLGNYQLRSDINELIQQYKPGEPLIFSASMDVPPQVNLGDYKGLKITAKERQYYPEEVEKFLQSQQNRLATLVPVENRPAQRGDVVVVDYEARLIDEAGEVGEVIQGAQANDFQIELDSGAFLEDLIQGIEGMSQDETKVIPVEFPEDYGREDLAGAKTQFTVTVKEIKEKELPELDDEFAQEVNEKFETLEALKADLEKQYKEKAQEETDNNIAEAITEALIESAEIDLPETLIEQEIESLFQQTSMEMRRYGVDMKTVMNSPEHKARFKENARPEAEKRLKSSLALLEVGKLESIEPENEELEKKVAEILEQFGGDRQADKIDMDRLRSFVKEDLVKEKTISWLQENLTIETVPEKQEAEENVENVENVESVENAAENPESGEDVSVESSSSSSEEE